MSEIMVSVWCLAYNHEKYIRDCLEGFVKQKTSFKFEVIVHDDASTDSTADIIQEYADKYPDIIMPIFQEENQYSKGVDISSKYIFPKFKGKYVAVCEGDDYWCDDCKLQKQVDILEANPDYIACVHQTKAINCLNKRESLTSPCAETGIIDKKIILERDSPIYHTSSLCYRRHLIDKRPVFCFITNKIGDYPLGLFLALEGPIYFINEIMSVYRLYTEGSWSLGIKKQSRNVGFARDMINVLTEVDKYSELKYHSILSKPLLEFEYKMWKWNPSIDILRNERFRLLNTSRKIKLIFRILFKIWS